MDLIAVLEEALTNCKKEVIKNSLFSSTSNLLIEKFENNTFETDSGTNIITDNEKIVESPHDTTLKMMAMN